MLHSPATGGPLKMLTDQAITRFVQAGANALEAEDKELRKWFSAYAERGFYTRYHHGIRYILEPQKLYVIVRGILGCQFPLEIAWENPRPGGGAVDLAFLEGGEVVGCIEAKDCHPPVSGDAHRGNLIADIEKLRRWPASVRKFLLVFWYPRSEDEAETEIKHFDMALPVRFRREWHCSFQTALRSGEHGALVDGRAAMTLLEVVS
jgi:hypothetical protein